MKFCQGSYWSKGLEVAVQNLCGCGSQRVGKARAAGTLVAVAVGKGVGVAEDNVGGVVVGDVL